jgi:hypothetical protein
MIIFCRHHGSHGFPAFPDDANDTNIPWRSNINDSMITNSIDTGNIVVGIGVFMLMMKMDFYGREIFGGKRPVRVRHILFRTAPILG